MIRVMIVDDHAVVRSGLSAFLLAFDDLEYVGEAAGGAEAVDRCLALKPDVILMDLVMPERGRRRGHAPHQGGVPATSR